jgi:serine/threonine protein kinase
MDYSAAGTLRQRYPQTSRDQRQMPLTECVNIVRQVAAGLQYAHQQKKIHRDIKPENMLIGRNEEILLSDFGIATINRSSRYQSQSGSGISGTIAYMAPELLQGKPTLASDQYALAIVVYEWLSGTLPFRGSFAEIGSQHLFAPPPPLQSRVPGLPLAVEQVIQTALAKDPAQRFLSVQEFASSLERAVYEQTFIPTYRKDQASGFMDSPSSPAEAITQEKSGSETAVSSPTSDTVVPSSPLAATMPAARPFSADTWPSPQNTQPPSFPIGTFRPSTHPQKQFHTRYTVIIAILVVMLVAVGSGTGILLASKNFPNNNPNAARSTGNPSSTEGSTATQRPAPSPTPVAPGTVLYQANWSDDLGSWIGSSEWKASQNGQIGSDGTSQNSFSIWAPVQMPTNNYAVEARIQYVRASFPLGGGSSTYSTDNYEFGIMVRGDTNEDGYEVGMSTIYDANILPEFIGRPRGALINLVQNDGNSSGAFDGLTQPQGVLANSQYQIDTNWHIYRVEVTGNSIKFFFDGALLVNTTDNTYINGLRVGLRAVYATIKVTGFKVTAL